MIHASRHAADPWLGPLPAGWSIKRLGALGELVKGRGGSKEDNRNAGIPVVRYGDLYTKFDTVITEPAAFVSEEDAAKYTPLPKHGLVFAASGESAEDIGKSAMSLLTEPAVVGGDAVVFHPGDEIDPLFLAYAVDSTPLRSSKTIRSSGFTVVHISGGKLKTLPIPLPPLGEQRAIAEYLDRETARIDTLIEEQQRLIEMLRARRQDLIRAAVLGDENPFSPSAAVAFTTIGHHFSVTLGKMLDAGKVARPDDRMLPYIRAGNIQDSGLGLGDVNEMPYSAAEAANLNLLAGDLLVVEGGAVGTNVMIREDMPGWSFQKTVNRLRPLDHWSSAWLGYVLHTYRDMGVIDIVCNKSTIAHLTAEKLRAMRVPSVAPAEQLRVVALLDQETAKIDELIAEAESFVELSRERRAALITAAVTGQVDVRELV